LKTICKKKKTVSKKIKKDVTIQFQRSLIDWFKKNKREFPWRQTNDAYRIAIAEILLRQTFARKVVPVYETLLFEYPDIYSLAIAKPQQIESIIYPLGLIYRASQLIKFADYIINSYGGEFPDTRKELESIPGIGQYSASAILCFAFGRAEPIVDTNVMRIYRRFFGIEEHSTSKGPNKYIFEISKELIPRSKKSKDYNLALLDFAALVCKHYKPKCCICPVNEHCEYFNSS
jgi:A/G-specific adenine glycosylase